MVQSIVDCLLTLLASRLGVHQLWFARVLCLGKLLSNFLCPLDLPHLEGSLISEELVLRPSLFPLLFVNLGLEEAVLGLFGVHFFNEALLLKFADAFTFPCRESLHVLLGCLFGGKFFLRKYE